MNNLKIFCDFDGTIANGDTWILLGQQFIQRKTEWAELIGKFENFEIGSRECFIKESSLVENFDKDIFDKIIDSQQIDPYFIEFKNFCDNNGLPIWILSEGMDYYIKRILVNYSLDINFYANKLTFADNQNKLELEFPYSDSDCTKCGCCKRNLLMNLCDDEDISVYIGDGLSDACVVNYADIIFAKKSLASYCWKNNITYFDYENFNDVKKKLEKILSQKNIKHRQTAKLKRREVFLQG